MMTPELAAPLSAQHQVSGTIEPIRRLFGATFANRHLRALGFTPIKTAIGRADLVRR